MDDMRIIALYEQRSEQAIAETQAKYGVLCRSIAYGILHSIEDAEECESDTYMQMWNTIPPAKPRSLSAFIGRIARNIALNIYQKYHAEKRSAPRTAASLEELAECIPDAASDFITEDTRVQEALNVFLRHLPAVSRNIFIRRYWFLDSVAEIAGRYHMKEGTVRVSLKRTRDKLRSYLAKEGIRL